MEFLLIIAVIVIIALVVKDIIKGGKTQKSVENEPEVTAEEIKSVKYQRKFLLTKYEYYFYKKLKPIADEMNLTILAKIRLADIVEPQSGQQRRDWNRSFAKIKAKHIDFALANPENLMIKLVIELNDSTHSREDRKKRDEFLAAVLEQTNIPFLQVTNDSNLKDKISEKINK